MRAPLLAVSAAAALAFACSSNDVGAGASDGGPGGGSADTGGGAFDFDGGGEPADVGPQFGPNSFYTQCSGTPTNVTGTVLAPNGTDPIPGAEVAVWAAAPAPLDTGVACELCEARPAVAALAAGRTAADGTFSLSLDAVDKAASYVLTARKGRFRKSSTIAVNACASTAATRAQTTLPGKAADGDLPKIAVASGNRDHLDNVVRAMGITEFDCVKGLAPSSSTTDTCGTPTMNLGQLLADPVKLKTYAMIFISCAPSDTYEPKTSADTAAKNLKDWVALGGKLVVTDDSYDFVEQPFPDAIDFAGSTPTAGVAQPQNSAEVGTFASSIGGTVVDAALADWLKLFPGAIDANKKVALKGFLTNWAVMKQSAAGTTTVVHGTAPFTGGPADVPLTSKFEVNKCGRVIFSSYHTDSGSTTALLPQERILEYLLFEVSVCTGGPT